jgi:hypothetical protein
MGDTDRKQSTKQASETAGAARVRDNKYREHVCYNICEMAHSMDVQALLMAFTLLPSPDILISLLKTAQNFA